MFYLFTFFSASVWALHRSTVVELVSGQILTLTFYSGLQLGFKPPFSCSYNCPFRGFAFSPHLSFFRQMSVFFLSLALWEFLQINKQFEEGNPLWDWRLWVSVAAGGSGETGCGLSLWDLELEGAGILLPSFDICHSDKSKFLRNFLWPPELYG